MACLVSRSGRHLQRYDNIGRRIVVGCIPYRFKRMSRDLEEEDELIILEVLVVSSRKTRGQGMLFPKGGWETDESIEEAATRETLEEAGVRGHFDQEELGQWNYKSKTRGIYHEGRLFPLLVTEQLDHWPEKDFRQRLWMNVGEAREVCKWWWMKEALDLLVDRLSKPNNSLNKA
ncbi:nudix hydrolase 17, mitochondrial-like [Impatiens glandulifera]|uniref:nudix hydrolase 17, mitochondrial-like n=1 Tax=Impatiens glandulifera TaxID=253017 RepID=UPI001FB08239|nr:nudix hydrolase 17, mitochondrial-like [Impatiens glandulifera]